MRESQTERFLLIGFILFAFFIVSPAPAAGTQTLISTLNSNWYHQLPKIYGDQIVWQDSDWINSYGIIYLYNITSGIETQITNNTTYTTNPAIYGNNIVWTDCGNYPACFNPSTLSQTASVIYLYNIPSRKDNPDLRRIGLPGLSCCLWKPDCLAGHKPDQQSFPDISQRYFSRFGSPGFKFSGQPGIPGNIREFGCMGGL